MKKVWISYCTEHEFGQRDDGFLVSDDFEAIKTKTEKNEPGGPGQYWSYTEPMEVWCKKKTFEKILKRKAKSTEGKIAYFGHRVKLKLFKQL